MSKQLEIGKNYGECFGLNPASGQQLIYKGENNWLAIKPGAERVLVSADTTAKALEYINRPSINMAPSSKLDK